MYEICSFRSSDGFLRRSFPQELRQIVCAERGIVVLFRLMSNGDRSGIQEIGNFICELEAYNEVGKQ